MRDVQRTIRTALVFAYPNQTSEKLDEMAENHANMIEAAAWTKRTDDKLTDELFSKRVNQVMMDLIRKLIIQKSTETKLEMLNRPKGPHPMPEINMVANKKKNPSQINKSVELKKPEFPFQVNYKKINKMESPDISRMVSLLPLYPNMEDDVFTQQLVVDQHTNNSVSSWNLDDTPRVSESFLSNLDYIL